MKYVALLRGINVGGNRKVDMKQLKAGFESAGMENVRTYINSGNVIFESSESAKKLVGALEKVILDDFGFEVKVLIRDYEQVKAVNEALPDAWSNDDKMKCDVMFLWEEVDDPMVIEQLRIKQGIDTVKYVAGAIIWSIDRANINKSGMNEIVGTALYKKMTIRNYNTTRKLLELMESREL